MKLNTNPFLRGFYIKLQENREISSRTPNSKTPLQTRREGRSAARQPENGVSPRVQRPRRRRICAPGATPRAAQRICTTICKKESVSVFGRFCPQFCGNILRDVDNISLKESKNYICNITFNYCRRRQLLFCHILSKCSQTFARFG